MKPTQATKTDVQMAVQPAPCRTSRARATVAATLIGLAYGALALAYLFPEDFRRSDTAYVAAAWVVFMIRTFSFHLGLGLAGLALVAAVLRRPRLLIATLPGLVLTLGPELWQYVPRATPRVSGPTFRIMTCNLLQPNTQTDAIRAEIQGANPDVLILQEYAAHWRAGLAPLAADYVERYEEERSDCFGLAIYSRYPFHTAVETRLAMGASDLPQARVVVELGGRKIAFYNVHLMPPKGLAWTAEQRRQVADLVELLRRERFPFVVCGDFNFPNNTAFAAELRKLGVRDVHALAGRGRGTTWPNDIAGGHLPGIRIDHVYLSKELTCTACRVGDGAGSDHRPIVAEIGLAE